MQAKQMAASLHHLAPLLAENGNSAQASLLLVLADALNKAGTATVSAAIKKFEKEFPGKTTTLSSSASSSLLDRISKVVHASGSLAASKDFAAAGKLLHDMGSAPTSEISQKLSNALVARPASSKRTKAPAVDVHAVANDLTKYSADSQRFGALVDEIKKLAKAELIAVAEEFMGYKRSYKTKDDVIAAIRAHQRQDALEASRDRSVSKIAV